MANNDGLDDWPTIVAGPIDCCNVVSMVAGGSAVVVFVSEVGYWAESC